MSFSLRESELKNTNRYYRRVHVKDHTVADKFRPGKNWGEMKKNPQSLGIK